MIYVITWLITIALTWFFVWMKGYNDGTREVESMDRQITVLKQRLKKMDDSDMETISRLRQSLRHVAEHHISPFDGRFVVTIGHGIPYDKYFVGSSVSQAVFADEESAVKYVANHYGFGSLVEHI